jgi:hypothetical protein
MVDDRWLLTEDQKFKDDGAKFLADFQTKAGIFSDYMESLRGTDEEGSYIKAYKDDFWLTEALLAVYRLQALSCEFDAVYKKVLSMPDATKAKEGGKSKKKSGNDQDGLPEFLARFKNKARKPPTIAKQATPSAVIEYKSDDDDNGDFSMSFSARSVQPAVFPQVQVPDLMFVHTRDNPRKAATHSDADESIKILSRDFSKLPLPAALWRENDYTRAGNMIATIRTLVQQNIHATDEGRRVISRVVDILTQHCRFRTQYNHRSCDLILKALGDVAPHASFIDDILKSSSAGVAVGGSAPSLPPFVPPVSVVFEPDEYEASYFNSGKLSSYNTILEYLSKDHSALYEQMKLVHPGIDIVDMNPKRPEGPQRALHCFVNRMCHRLFLTEFMKPGCTYQTLKPRMMDCLNRRTARGDDNTLAIDENCFFTRKLYCGCNPQKAVDKVPATRAFAYNAESPLYMDES